MTESVHACGAGTLRLHRLELPDSLASLSFDVWYCRVEDVPASVLADPAELGWLSEEELERHGSLRFPRDRDMFLTTRLLARAVLSRYALVSPANWEFTRNEWGRPEIDPFMAFETGAAGLNFNLSRSGDLAVCVVTRMGTVGIDIADLHSRVDAAATAQEVLAEDELNALEQLPEAARKSIFLHFWALKEAFVKALGIGLSLDVRDISFRQTADHRIVADYDGSVLDPETGWHFVNMTLFDRYTLAIAFQADPESFSDDALAPAFSSLLDTEG